MPKPIPVPKKLWGCGAVVVVWCCDGPVLGVVVVLWWCCDGPVVQWSSGLVLWCFVALVLALGLQRFEAVGCPDPVGSPEQVPITTQQLGELARTGAQVGSGVTR